MFIYEVGFQLGEIEIDPIEIVSEIDENRLKILSKTGFTKLYKSEKSSEELALLACRNMTGRVRENIDYLICVSSVIDSAPSIAIKLHAKLKLKSNVPFLQIQDACTGFTRALELCSQIIQSKGASNILLILTDTYRQYFSSSQLHLSTLFSDGSSAFIISSTNKLNDDYSRSLNWEVLKCSQVINGNLDSSLTIMSRDEKLELEMNGASVFQFVATEIGRVIEELSQSNGNEIQRWYLHQGSKITIDAVSSILKKDGKDLFKSSNYGNVVGSSIPFQLHDEQFNFSGKFGMLSFGMGLNIHGLVIENKI